MSKTQLRIASLFSLLAGAACIPLSSYLFPYAQAADSIPGPDGQRYIVTVDAGAWIFKVGFAAAVVFICLSCVLLWLSYRSRKQA